MAKNDIALSFDKAEYYSLEEACDYLNRKHGIDNITPKKLLKHIVSYDTPTFIHFRANNLENCFLYFDFYKSNIFGNNEALKELSKLDNSYIDFVMNIGREIEEKISNRLIDYVYAGEILFKVSDTALSNMALLNNISQLTHSFTFDGFVTKKDLNQNPSKPKLLKETYIEKENEKFFIEDITNISFILNTTNDDNIKNFIESFPFEVKFEVIEEKLWVEFYISINDLIILHKDLEQLENQVIENAPIPHKELSKNSDNLLLQARQGVSRKRLEAKLIANAHAQNLWAKDHDKQIRISEMCNHVWNYLVDTEYQTELPNERKSLKSWLTDIPPHASDKGRPSNS